MGNSTSTVPSTVLGPVCSPAKEVLSILKGIDNSKGDDNYTERLPEMMDDTSRSTLQYTVYIAAMKQDDLNALAKAGYNAVPYRETTIILFVNENGGGVAPTAIPPWKRMGKIKFASLADLVAGTPITAHGTFGSTTFFLRTVVPPAALFKLEESGSADTAVATESGSADTAVATTAAVLERKSGSTAVATTGDTLKEKGPATITAKGGRGSTKARRSRKRFNRLDSDFPLSET